MECCDELSNGISGVEDSQPMSEPTIDHRVLTSDNFCFHKGKENSSSDRIILSPPCDSSVLRFPATSEFVPDLVIPEFPFRFRPSDNEVLVQNKGKNKYLCNVCGSMYTRKYNLTRHFQKTHINRQYISNSGVSTCKIAVSENYVKHESNAECGKMSDGRKKFKSSNSILTENNKNRVMPGLYVCHICDGVKFDFEHELRDHCMKHVTAERKKFQCDKCSASFSKKHILSRHLASHCGKVVQKDCRRRGTEDSTKVKVKYEKNLASHSSGRVCKFCYKILSTRANRKRHESLHSEVKPYRCMHCDMCFAEGMDLDRHLRMQHKNLCHFCDDCCKCFPSPASLQVHMLETHSGAIAKNNENSCSPEPAPRVENTSSVTSAVSVRQKICATCKQSFKTGYALMKHRSDVHSFRQPRKRNKKTTKQKLDAKETLESNTETTVESQNTNTLTDNNNIPSHPVKRGRPPRRNKPAGPKISKKREKELAEEKFYSSLPEKGAENLLHYVDGKASQLNLKQSGIQSTSYNFIKGYDADDALQTRDQEVRIEFPGNELNTENSLFDTESNSRPQYKFNYQMYTACNFGERGRCPLSNYNFWDAYHVDHALKTRGQEVNRLNENLSSQDKFIFSIGLNRVQNSIQTTIKAPVENPIETLNSVP